MRTLRWCGAGLLGLVVLITAVGVAARLGDGPLGPFPGGPFESGEFAQAEEFERFIATNPPSVELQLLKPPGSRTVGVIVREGRAYITCVVAVPPFKRWHLDAQRDGRAVVRAQGQRYAVELLRVRDDALQRAQREAFPAGGVLGSAEIWFFRVAPRAL